MLNYYPEHYSPKKDAQGGDFAQTSGKGAKSLHCTEVRFDSFLSGGSTTMAVINSPERKLAKRTFVQWIKVDKLYYFKN